MDGVSDEERRIAARQAAALVAAETDEPGSDEQREAAIAAANADRLAAGLDELKTEIEFHRKAVALGLIR
ncbi:MAG: hypothetical protein ACKO1Y_08775 [Actinomycetota bacterium]